ncbi:hypothetical protein T492DRAFT_984274 [Pavlovales sp. CCMP2436]|nr:hypothetical protein T492DRAFT_984274 [Pavlovales sp. CCMP2436]
MASASDVPSEGAIEHTHRPLKNLSAKKIAKFNAENARKGVCYLARVAPYMKPEKLRHLLSDFGTDVLRIYLAPEDKASRTRRLKSGGNKKVMFIEGWVEFEDKAIAKRIAASLNNTAIGGSKRSFYAQDLWNLKYLSKFKWDDLTEKIAYERKVREQRLQLELAQAKRENTFYLQKVDQSKAIGALEARKRSRQPAVGADTPTSAAPAKPTPAAAGVEGADDAVRARRQFKQKPVLKAPTERSAPASGLGLLAKVLTAGSENRAATKPKRAAAGLDAPAATLKGSAKRRKE